jgi:ABC-2 type transport system permease protein
MSERATDVPATVTGSRLRYTVSDWSVLTKRNLVTYIRKPDLLVFSTIQPVMFVLLFVYVFGGAFEQILPPNVSYVDFLMPGIFVQTGIFAAMQTGVGLADDLQKGLIDRFRSLPMARSAVLAGRTAADTVSVVFQALLMLIVAYLVGYRLHEGILESLLAFLVLVAVGYSFTWMSAFAGLSLKTIEAVQAATFTIVFPFVFVSSAFVPVETFPTWLQGFANANPVTIWVDTVRVLTLGQLYTESSSELFRDVPALGTLLWQSAAWVAGIMAVFATLGVRVYRRT